MIVLKFGGAALADAKNIRNAVRVIQQVPQPVVVVSAMKGITDALLESIQHALDKEYDQTLAVLEDIRTRNQATAQSLLPSADIRTAFTSLLSEKLKELERILYSISVLNECTPKSKDYIISFGERLNSHLVCAALNQAGSPAAQYDGEDLIRTDSNFGFAYPDFEITREKLLAMPLDSIPVITGFIGANDKGETTTLGRGGTDFTAAIVAYSLDADEAWYMKEVDGIMTADPRVVENAVVIPEISYDEVAELSYFGAKVLHPVAIRPLREKSIPVYIKNVYKPELPGSRIMAKPVRNGKLAKAVTCIRDVALITIEGQGMTGIPGFSGRTFSTLARNETSILMISQSSSEQNICFVVLEKDVETAIEALKQEFELEILKKQINRIQAQMDIAIISMVGAGMINTPGISGRLFSAMGKNNINVIMVAQGSSELNISFVINEDETAGAIRAIHDTFNMGT